MANTTITRAQALQFAIDNIDNDEVKDVLGKMLAQVTKPRAAAVSKARKVNENLATKLADTVEGEVTTKDVVALGIPEIGTTQKAAAVLKVAVELGFFEKVTEGKKVTYRKVTE